LKRLRALSACLLLITGVCQAAVTVSGDVANPGPVELPARGRLLDVISVAQPNAEGYWLAGVLLRQSLLEQQTRLKAGVLFDLEVLQRMAMLFDRPSRAALACGWPSKSGACRSPGARWLIWTRSRWKSGSPAISVWTTAIADLPDAGQ
jgi:hypothetical protein